MAFIRRHYYDLTSGDTVLSYMRKGDVVTGSVEKDLTNLGRDMSTTGVMEWHTPDPDIERGFSTAWAVSVKDGAISFLVGPPPVDDSQTGRDATPEERIASLEEELVKLKGETHV